jgi:hypothetical protein
MQMRTAKFVLFVAIAGFLLIATTPAAQAQVGINIGVAPDCPYGYYDVAPYACAPAGYYGPEWFDGGAFIGVGPWFHGHDDFRGYVDNHFHPDHGYKGAMPQRGERAEPSRRVDAGHFKGNEMRDGRGHVAKR